MEIGESERGLQASGLLTQGLPACAAVGDMGPKPGKVKATGVRRGERKFSG